MTRYQCLLKIFNFYELTFPIFAVIISLGGVFWCRTNNLLTTPWAVIIFLPTTLVCALAMMFTMPKRLIYHLSLKSLPYLVKQGGDVDPPLNSLQKTLDYMMKHCGKWDDSLSYTVYHERSDPSFNTWTSGYTTYSISRVNSNEFRLTKINYTWEDDKPQIDKYIKLIGKTQIDL